MADEVKTDAAEGKALKKKRSAGYYRKRGKDTYELNYRRNTRTVTAKNDAEAEKALAKLITEVEAGKFKKPAKLTLRQLSERYLRDYSKLSDATRDNYRIHIENRIIPCLGDNKIDKIKPTHIYDFINNLKEDGIREDGKSGGLSPASIKKIYNILSSMFSFAVEMKELEENPCASVTPPVIPKRKPVGLEKDPSIKLLQALKNESLKYRVITLIAATTGMRRGEIIGISDSTLDLKNCSLIINQAARHRTGVGVYLNNPKSENSVRAIPFPPSIVPLIEELITARGNQRIDCGDLWHDKILAKDGNLVKNDLLFTQWNGKAMHPNSIDTWFAKFKEDNDLPENLTFHGLRHTNIKLLLKAGVDITTVSENSGHVKRATTLDYDDPSPEALREVPQKIDTVLNLPETVAGLLNLPVNVRRKGKKRPIKSV